MAAFRDMEEVSQGLLSLLGANRAEAQQRRLLRRHEQVVERLLETQDGAEQRLREVLTAEKEVAQSLLNAKAEAHQGGVELQQLEAELQRASEEDARLKTSLLYPFLCVQNSRAPASPRRPLFTLENTPGANSPGPNGVGVSTWAALPSKPGVLNCLFTQLSQELEELKEIEADLERQEREVDEDTTVTIPSAVYVAQLYRRISKIEWDYECEPGMIKGIHHGPSVAQPIHLESTQLSKKFISDYLWSLVDTEW
ncbi:kinetochore protein Spc24 [Balaenoptera acutorostrata]|uniref:Kinetochore protein Spc24 n=1 Tax=Balaenoptera acutorostrata TaxID=9767 RepID=A0ABM3T0S1_BALAC|nr:kinetochore protein Spc24 [Balaenoptera acutorostrata]